MTTYYLVDMHVPNGSLRSASRIVDTLETTSPGSEFRVDGLVPIRVPDGVRVVNPTSLDDLLTQKYLGILAQYPGFTHIASDDFLDDTGVDPALGLANRKTGWRATMAGGVETVAITLGLTVSQCILVFETFTWRITDSVTDRVARFYIEEPESLHDVSMSVNGTDFTSNVNSGALIEIVPAEQGHTLKIQFGSQTTPDAPLRLVNWGSWALVYRGLPT